MPTTQNETAGADDRFATTRWSLVVAAADAETGREALATLCQTYWVPLHAYVRRRVQSEDEARDLTQGFFARLLERNDFAAARRERGRFRAYLLGALKHFLANEWDRARAQKRGGGQTPLSLDFADGESRLRWEVGDPVTPEQVYERQWVATLLERVFEELRAEQVEKDGERRFEALKIYLTGDAPRGSYAATATELELNPGAVRMAVQRLRERYRQLLRRQIAQTVSEPAEVDEEIGRLFAAVRPSPRIL